MSITAEIHNRYLFSEHVLFKLMKFGVEIFGGATRNRLARSIHEEDRKKQYGPDYFINMWDPDFDPKTIHNRKGTYDDIDGICTIDVFEMFNSPEIKKFGDLNYSFIEKSTIYPIKNTSISLDEVKSYRGHITSLIPQHNVSALVKVDLIVCKDKKVMQSICEILNKNLDFECNGVCMTWNDEKDHMTMHDNRIFDRMMNIQLKIRRTKNIIPKD